jgi:hypothetical protein
LLVCDCDCDTMGGRCCSLLMCAIRSRLRFWVQPLKKTWIVGRFFHWKQQKNRTCRLPPKKTFKLRTRVCAGSTSRWILGLSVWAEESSEAYSVSSCNHKWYRIRFARPPLASMESCYLKAGLKAQSTRTASPRPITSLPLPPPPPAIRAPVWHLGHVGINAWVSGYNNDVLSSCLNI